MARQRDARTSPSSSTPGTHASGPAVAMRRTVAAPLTSRASTRSTRRPSASRSSGGASPASDGQDRARTPEMVIRPRPAARPRRRARPLPFGSASRATSQTAVERPICSAASWSSAARSRARRLVSNTSSWERSASVRTGPPSVTNVVHCRGAVGSPVIRSDGARSSTLPSVPPMARVPPGHETSPTSRRSQVKGASVGRELEGARRRLRGPARDRPHRRWGARMRRSRRQRGGRA